MTFGCGPATALPGVLGRQFHVNAPINHAPVATASDFAATHNQNIAASSLFTVTDADSDSITNYQFWDSTTDPASGHWVVGGMVRRAPTRAST